MRIKFTDSAGVKQAVDAIAFTGAFDSNGNHVGRVIISDDPAQLKSYGTFVTSIANETHDIDMSGYNTLSIYIPTGYSTAVLNLRPYYDAAMTITGSVRHGHDMSVANGTTYTTNMAENKNYVQQYLGVAGVQLKTSGTPGASTTIYYVKSNT